MSYSCKSFSSAPVVYTSSSATAAASDRCAQLEVCVDREPKSDRVRASQLLKWGAEHEAATQRPGQAAVMILDCESTP
eukprot:2434009-Rhodomonas_salina.2